MHTHDKKVVCGNMAPRSSSKNKEYDKSDSSKIDFYYEYDVKSHTRRFYGNADNYLGYPLCGAPCTTKEWSALIHPDDLERVTKLWGKCLESGETLCATYRVKGKDGDYNYFEDHCMPVDFDEGKPTRFIGTYSVIKNRVKDRASFKKRLRFEEFISDLSATFVNLPANKVDEEIERTLKYLAEYMHLDRVSLYQFEKDMTTIYLTHSYAIDDPKLKIIKQLTKRDLKDQKQAWNHRAPYFAEKMRQGELVCVKAEDLPIEASLERQFFIKYGVKSALLIPVTIDELVVLAISFGSYRFIISWPDELIRRLRLVGEIVANALQRKRAEQELQKAFYEIKELKNQVEADRNYLQEEIKQAHDFEEIIGKSDEIKYVLYKVDQVASTDTTVLVLGETGTGKELIARAIHARSKRNNRPLVKVDCSTLPSSIIESELFGHAKGAFTGAHVERVGRFELADGATIFLDEIGELPLELQPKLLRVLQDGGFERLGSSQTIKVNVRIIAATNRNLEEEIQNGRFRKDLFYRLNIFPILIPPIRKRKEDILLLLNHFARKFSKKLGKQVIPIPSDDIKSLIEYDWPGNIRELENLVARAVIAAEDSKLHFDIPSSINKLVGDTNKLVDDTNKLEDIEREHIIQVLEETNGKISGKNGAASMLGLHPNTLRSKMKKLGIRKQVIFNQK